MITALSSKDKWEWGCLSQDGMLFQIASLSYTQVPMHTVDDLEKREVIKLITSGMSKGFYKYEAKVTRRCMPQLKRSSRRRQL